MIKATDMLVAMRCPKCGQLDYHTISRFGFSSQKKKECYCTCGAVKLIITTKDHKSYWLQVPCVVCENNHVRQISGKKLWSSEITSLYCQEIGVELGYIGPAEEVKKLSMDLDFDNVFDCFSSDLVFEDEYFHNSEIMYEVLNCLRDIAEQGLLYCQCGKQSIEVDIFPDCLELRCQDCDRAHIIYAETEDDLQVIKNMVYIELTNNDFEYLDSLSNTHKSGRKPHRKHK